MPVHSYLYLEVKGVSVSWLVCWSVQLSPLWMTVVSVRLWMCLLSNAFFKAAPPPSCCQPAVTCVCQQQVCQVTALIHTIITFVCQWCLCQVPVSVSVGQCVSSMLPLPAYCWHSVVTCTVMRKCSVSVLESLLINESSAFPVLQSVVTCIQFIHNSMSVGWLLFQVHASCHILNTFSIYPLTAALCEPNMYVCTH